LIDALSVRLPDMIQYNSLIESIARDPESGWRLTSANGDQYSASIVICAAPAFVAARLLKSHAHRLAAGLAKISYASAATLNLAWRVMDFPHLPNSFGFVVPVIERRKIIEMLETVSWSQTDAAEQLHIPLSTLNQKIKRLNIDVKRKGA